MVEKIKTDVDRLLLDLKFKKSSILAKYIGIFCSFSKPEVLYLRPFVSFLPFHKFWEQNFMYFAHNHVETGPNYSHEIPNFLKYHMPLRA